jgi:putative redox protein
MHFGSRANNVTFLQHLHQEAAKEEFMEVMTKVMCGQPRDNGGSDEGMSPPEFLFGIPGWCTAYYAAQYLASRHLRGEDLRVKVSAKKAAPPARLASFQIEVAVTGLDDRHQARILRA